jgi:hypothetical protein
MTAKNFEIEPKVNGRADAEPAAEPLPFITFANMHPNLEAGSLVKGLLGKTAMSVVYGDSETGKSHLVLDLALHIALGREWMGRRVTQGCVLYVAGEGGAGIRNRVSAFRQHHGIAEDVPFAVIPAPVDLCSENADTDRLIATINEVAATFDCPLVLVIVDTLSRAMAGGNENSSEDMGAYVMNVDLIKAATQAHILSVHHCGKDQARGARGHSLLRAATDTEIEVARNKGEKVSTVQITKQRDLPKDETAITFRLISIELGQTIDDDLVSACIVEPAEPSPFSAPPTKITGQPKIALDLLTKAIENEGELPPASHHIPGGHFRVVPIDLWRRYCKTGGLAGGDNEEAFKKAWKRSRDRLVSLGYVRIWNDLAWIVAHQGDKGT